MWFTDQIFTVYGPAQCSWRSYLPAEEHTTAVGVSTRSLCPKDSGGAPFWTGEENQTAQKALGAGPAGQDVTERPLARSLPSFPRRPGRRARSTGGRERPLPQQPRRPAPAASPQRRAGPGAAVVGAEEVALLQDRSGLSRPDGPSGRCCLPTACCLRVPGGDKCLRLLN